MCTVKAQPVSMSPWGRREGLLELGTHVLAGPTQALPGQQLPEFWNVLNTRHAQQGP